MPLPMARQFVARRSAAKIQAPPHGSAPHGGLFPNALHSPAVAQGMVAHVFLTARSVLRELGTCYSVPLILASNASILFTRSPISMARASVCTNAARPAASLGVI